MAGSSRAPKEEVPFGIPKKLTDEEAAALAEESKRLSISFKGEAKQHLERVRGLQAQVEEEKSAKHLLTEAVGSLEASMEVEKAAAAAEKTARKSEEASTAVANDRARRAVQIARQLEELVQTYAQLPTEPAVKMHVQELHARLYSIGDELGAGGA